jgi:hypothetical protein
MSAVALQPSTMRAPRCGRPSPGLREIGRVSLAVAGDPHRAREIVGAQQRVDAPGLGGVTELEVDAEALRARHLPFEQLEPLGGFRDVEAAASLQPGGEVRLGLERRRLQLDAVAAHPRRVARRA